MADFSLWDFGKGLLKTGADIGTDMSSYASGRDFSNNLSGLFDLSGGLDYLQKNKSNLETMGSLLSTGANIYQIKEQADYLDFLKKQSIESTAREQQREEEAEEAMATGFQQSGLADYYGV